MSDEIDRSGCPNVQGDTDAGEDELTPFCIVATRVALLRRSLLDSARATAVGALEQLDDPTIGDKFLRHNLKILIDTLDEDTGAGGVGEVSYDELLEVLVSEFEETITSDAVTLLRTAQTAAHALLGNGWVVARSEKLRN